MRQDNSCTVCDSRYCHGLLTENFVVECTRFLIDFVCTSSLGCSLLHALPDSVGNS